LLPPVDVVMVVGGSYDCHLLEQNDLFMTATSSNKMTFALLNSLVARIIVSRSRRSDCSGCAGDDARAEVIKFIGWSGWLE